MDTDIALKNFFYPSSVCIAGASSKEKSIGYELLRSIKSYGYKGKIFPVNPKAVKILGYKCYPSVKDISSKIDLAIVVVPKIFTEETIDHLLSKKVSSIILITAGFKEVGEEGKKLEEKILLKIKEAGARLVGPNCMGVINTFEEVKLNATFVAEKPELGKTAFFSQSGAICAAVLNSLRETGIKFGHFISAGNKADICENDMLLFWEKDKRIKTITFYLESFEKGEEFIKLFAKNEIKKPVIMLKAGKSATGIKAAQSHTGALGTNDKVVDAVLDQFGIIRANNLNELFNTAKGFENFPLPAGNRVAVITNGGGPAILAVDALVKEGLKLADLSPSTKNKLKKIIHPEGSAENPVDLLPGGTPEQFKAVNEIVMKDKNVDSAVSIFVEPVMVTADEVIKKINEIKTSKPLFQAVMPLPEFWSRYKKSDVSCKPVFRNPEDPAKVISNMLFYKKKKVERSFLRPKFPDVDLSSEDGFLSPKMINCLADRYVIPIVPSLLIKSGIINKSAAPFTYPLVLKGYSRELIHKSEMGAVKIDIKSYEELLQAEMDILEAFNKNNLELSDFLIQPYIKPKYEILIGGFRDPVFGPIVMFGTGGKYVEVINDICMKSAYLCDKDIEEIIGRTKMGELLKGARGESAVDLSELKELIKSSARMLLYNPSIIEFDFNPVIISKNDKIFVVDVRIKK
ncbi:MAG TPA: acetate--CoA ligase family protein [Ignavibacteriaceae bacterium]|nr:acetate--CoA ligase family protein [Ignavibacteriaceae bacterium]